MKENNVDSTAFHTRCVVNLWNDLCFTVFCSTVGCCVTVVNVGPVRISISAVLCIVSLSKREKRGRVPFGIIGIPFDVVVPALLTSFLSLPLFVVVVLIFVLTAKYGVVCICFVRLGICRVLIKLVTKICLDFSSRVHVPGAHSLLLLYITCMNRWLTYYSFMFGCESFSSVALS